MNFILRHQTGNDIWDPATFFFNVFCCAFPPSAALLKQLHYKTPSNGSHTAPGSLGYTRGVRGDKWRSGVRRAAFSPSPPITSQAVRESDSFALFQSRLGKVDLEKVEPALVSFYLQRKSRGTDGGPVQVPLQWDRTITALFPPDRV